VSGNNKSLYICKYCQWSIITELYQALVITYEGKYYLITPNKHVYTETRTTA